MMTKLEQLLQGQGGNHILPFLWMHGEPHDVIREEVAAIASCGIGEMCIESRPHPDFGGPHWWSDVDVVMDEARQRAMRVWVLDDNKFPTGHANGAYEACPEKAKWYLAERHMDLIGPAQDTMVLVAPFLPKDARLLSILAYPRPDLDQTDISLDGVIDPTESLNEGFVRMDLPAGAYRLFVLFATQTGGGRPHYMNLIDAESVRVLIDAVYEPHYARYRDDFGKTFAGFFSDEPELGNTPGYDFHETLGKPDMRLPWSSALEERLRAAWGADFARNLPALWYGAGEQDANIRYHYMDVMTRLVGECLSGQLGAWCAERGVEYIGHIIEDDNAHGRMGCSIGHYFREQAGQHISGIDVVHHQIVPGFTGTIHRWVGWQHDGEFFHFGLAKLGSSAAHLYPHMQGRALCEIFGNYGWGEGIGMMKWLTDHMLCRGINRFVPHAFSPTFPDRDCPPHFYARGNNPQFGFFQALMRYMNRVSFLLSGARFPADAAVLYHADAEWGGDAMLFQKPVRALMERQLGCDVVPCDLLGAETASVERGRLLINGNAYAALVIPGCDFLPEEATRRIEELASEGLAVLFVEKRPAGISIGRVISLADVATEVAAIASPEISLDAYLPNLRFFCAEHATGEKVYFFFNEDIAARADCHVQILQGSCAAMAQYDATANRSETFLLEANRFSLSLAPGESTVLVPLAVAPQGTRALSAPCEEIPLSTAWRVSAAPQDAPGEFTPLLTIPEGAPLPNLGKPGFTGVYRYECTFPAHPAARAVLYFPQVSDGAEIWINDEPAGMVLGNSDQVDVSRLLREGENTLRVEIATTLVWTIKDPVSVFTQLAPVGLMEAPRLLYYEGGSHE